MLRNRRERQRAILALIGVLAILSGAGFVALRTFDKGLQALVYDSFIQAAPAKVKNQITIVAIDDKTIEQYGRWPLPRQAYVDLIKALKPFNPSAIAFDVGFYDPSDKPDQDQALAAAIKESGNVILAMQGVGVGEWKQGVQNFPKLQMPLGMFREAAAGLGSVNINADTDSRVREAQLVVAGPEGKFYALPLVATAKHLRGNLAKIRSQGDLLVLPTAAAERIMPLDEGGSLRVYYASPPATGLLSDKGACSIPGEFCVVSLVDVVNGKVARPLLLNRSVYVGAHSVSAVPDDYPVPNSGERKMYGVEIWANTAQSIFTNRYPTLHQGFLLTLLQIAIVSVIGILLVARFRLVGFLAALVALVLYGAAQLFLFIIQTSGEIGNGPIAVPSLAYLLPAVFWWIVVLGYLLIEEQVAVRRTQSTFGRFVTPSVAKTILDAEEKGALGLGGQLKPMTVLFGDIRGFTTMSEGMDPAELLATLNRYFEGMVEIVTRYEGTVNKYNGDNIMVIWNAPLEVAEHPRKAVECALEIQKWIVAERAKGGPDVSFGFGLNSGTAIAGFLGASGRMEYTVIGDTVNVASRLTSNDIARRDQVACSRETLEQLGQDVVSVDLGAIFVKGRAEPVRCFQVDRIGLVANPNPAPPPEVPIGKAAVAGYH